MKLKPIKQKDSIACGPTCIQMVSIYFAQPFSFAQIARTTHYKKEDGLTNVQLRLSLEKLGFKVTEKNNATWNDLKKYNTKKAVIIISWMLDGYKGHFSILDSVSEKHIKLIDPEIGKVRRLDKLQFMRLWMDYDGLWFPKKNTDIQLRWMAVVTKK